MTMDEKTIRKVGFIRPGKVYSIDVVTPRRATGSNVSGTEIE
jgi:hypothetical protein